MITLPNGKICMNEQEAIQWLLDNYPIPFQCSANYAADTEIGLGTIVNPTPAKVKVGSIIFFADSKVSTVVGLTANGFICSDKYNDLVDDVVYVSNVQLNASGHLIVTLSNATTIDAGLIKQVTGFSINSSQHLIVSYNDGTTTDLGAIFQGNVNIAGNFTADSIIENMTGYSFTKQTDTAAFKFSYTYASACKNGNKLTLVLVLNLTRTASNDITEIGRFIVPVNVGNRLFNSAIGSGNPRLTAQQISAMADYNSAINVNGYVNKNGVNEVTLGLSGLNNLTLNQPYFIRFELTFLLGENLAA